MSYVKALKQLETLVRAHEAVTEAMDQAAEAVLEAAQQRKNSSPGPRGTGRITPYRSVDYLIYVRRKWAQAKTKDERNYARKMMREGIAFGFIDVGTAKELQDAFGDDE